jgi:hypothetical protein
MSNFRQCDRATGFRLRLHDGSSWKLERATYDSVRFIAANDHPDYDVVRAGAGVTGGVKPRIDGEACAGEDKGAVEGPGLFNGMAIQSDGLSVASSV